MAKEDVTLVPAEFFDDLLAALVASDETPREVAELARRPRSFELE